MSTAIQIIGPGFSTEEWRTRHDAATMLDSIADILIKHIKMATAYGYHFKGMHMKPVDSDETCLDCVLDFGTVKPGIPLYFGKLPFEDKPVMQDVWAAFKDKLLAATTP